MDLAYDFIQIRPNNNKSMNEKQNTNINNKMKQNKANRNLLIKQ